MTNTDAPTVLGQKFQAMQQSTLASGAPRVGKLQTELYQDGTPPRLHPIPTRYRNTQVGRYLKERFDGDMYLNQAVVAKLLDEGKQVVQTTPTGSGKTEPFMAEAFHTILTPELSGDKDARVVVFYPLRNLNTDQTRRWKDMAEELGLPEGTVANIDGGTPMGDRLGILGRARILLATPDVFHAWAMQNVDQPIIRNFITHCRLTVLDEMDSYNGLFGTNMMYLLRRMEHIQSRTDIAFMRGDDHRYMGSSATLPNATQFFRQLTGHDATEVGMADNGAPTHHRMVGHYAVDAERTTAGVAELVESFLATTPEDEKMMVFVNSRAGVEHLNEHLNSLLGKGTSIPDKQGYSADIQEQLEKIWAGGSVRVKVTTSKSEAGVDDPFVTCILNVGVPWDKRQAVQRIGRCARHQPGMFLFVAPQDAFNLGNGITNLADYMEHMPLPVPTLYPQNEFIQLCQAFCMSDESRKLESCGIKLNKPFMPVVFPSGMGKALKKATSGVRDVNHPEHGIPAEQRLLIPARTHMRKPQLFHPLRSMSQGAFKLVRRMPGATDVTPIGSCDLPRAMEEYYPGAITMHAGKRMQVSRWNNTKGQDQILMFPYNGADRTRPTITSWASAWLNSSTVLKDTFYQGNPVAMPTLSDGTVVPDGTPFAALSRGRVARTLSGFITMTEGGQVFTQRYFDDQDLSRPEVAEMVANQHRDYGPPRHFKMPTTGLILHIPEKWFGEKARETLGEMIVKSYAETERLHSNDIGFTYTRIGANLGEKKVNDHLLYVYDKTPGSLGLTHNLMRNGSMDGLLQLLRTSTAAMSPEGTDDERYRIGLVKQLYSSLIRMKQSAPPESTYKSKPLPKLPSGFIRMIAPGSLAMNQMDNGSSSRVKVLMPTVLENTPGYMVEAVNRKVFFSANHSYANVVVTQTGITATGRQHAPARAELESHFIGSRYMTLEEGGYVGMNPKTGEIVMPHEEAGITLWKPWENQPEQEQTSSR